MKRTSIIIVIGVLTFMIVGIVLFVISMDYQGETVTLMDDEVIAADLDETVVEEKEESLSNMNGFSFEGSEFLMKVMSDSEYNQFISFLGRLYMDDFAGYVNLDVKTESYYSENSGVILETTGLESYDQFQRLYNKLVVIPDYDSCHVLFLEDTMLDDGDRIYVDLRVTYDGISEVEFYLILDKRTLEHRIF